MEQASEYTNVRSSYNYSEALLNLVSECTSAYRNRQQGDPAAILDELVNSETLAPLPLNIATELISHYHLRQQETLSESLSERYSTNAMRLADQVLQDPRSTDQQKGLAAAFRLLAQTSEDSTVDLPLLSPDSCLQAAAVIAVPLESDSHVLCSTRQAALRRLGPYCRTLILEGGRAFSEDKRRPIGGTCLTPTDFESVEWRH